MTEENKNFRNIMYGLMIALLLTYVGYKAWHLSLAMEMFEGQGIVIQQGQPAK